MNVFEEEESLTKPHQWMLDRFCRSNRLISRGTFSNRLKKHYYELLEKARKGNLLRVHHLKSLRSRLEDNNDAETSFQIIVALAEDIANDYEYARDIYLRHHASFAIDNCIDDIDKYLIDTAPCKDETSFA